MKFKSIDISTRLVVALIVMIINTFLLVYLYISDHNIKKEFFASINNANAIISKTNDIDQYLFSLYRNINKVKQSYGLDNYEIYTSKIKSLEIDLDLAYNWVIDKKENPVHIAKAYHEFLKTITVREQLIREVFKNNKNKVGYIINNKGEKKLDEILALHQMSLESSKNELNKLIKAQDIFLKRSFTRFLILFCISVLFVLVIAIDVYYSIENPLAKLIKRIEQRGLINFDDQLLFNHEDKFVVLEAAIAELEIYRLKLERLVLDRTAELEQYKISLEEKVIERTKEIEKINRDLKKSNEELNNSNKELERFNKLFIGREFRINELKIKVKELERKIQEKF